MNKTMPEEVTLNQRIERVLELEQKIGLYGVEYYSTEIQTDYAFDIANQAPDIIRALQEQLAVARTTLQTIVDGCDDCSSPDANSLGSLAELALQALNTESNT